jgi:hypothetical protein
MKKLLLFLSIASSGAASAQETTIPKNENGNYEYSSVIAVDSLSADKLYSNA